MKKKRYTLSSWALRIGKRKLRAVLADAGISRDYFDYALAQRACHHVIYPKLRAAAQRHCNGIVPTFEEATIARADGLTGQSTEHCDSEPVTTENAGGRP
jgi:hypothetical protein